MTRQERLSRVMTSAAMTGLLAGAVQLAGCDKASSESSRPAVQSDAGTVSTTMPVAVARHDCMGKNACKGQGGCESGDKGCKGKNSCKGKGGCSM